MMDLILEGLGERPHRIATRSNGCWAPASLEAGRASCACSSRDTTARATLVRIVRVEEMLRQIRRILGPENIELSVMTQNFDLTRGYFGDAAQVHLPDVFPPFLHAEVGKNHGVVACEGSMFKSKFTNALTAMMIGALGIASAQNKLSVAYGAEAGAMDAALQKMCRRYCSESLVITRNVESQEVLGKLGVATELGTDTAWTFEPLPPEYGRKALRDAGWDGATPILAVCPINPFLWPVSRLW